VVQRKIGRDFCIFLISEVHLGDFINFGIS
jgi:hypothetical protein